MLKCATRPAWCYQGWFLTWRYINTCICLLMPPQPALWTLTLRSMPQLQATYYNLPTSFLAGHFPNWCLDPMQRGDLSNLRAITLDQSLSWLRGHTSWWHEPQVRRTCQSSPQKHLFLKQGANRRERKEAIEWRWNAHFSSGKLSF